METIARLEGHWAAIVGAVGCGLGLVALLWGFYLLGRRSSKVHFSKTNDAEDWTAAGAGAIRVVTRAQWKAGLNEYIEGRETLEEHLRKWSGCIIKEEPAPTVTRDPWNYATVPMRYPIERMYPIGTAVYFSGSNYYGRLF